MRETNSTKSQRIYEPLSSQMSKDAVRSQTQRLDEAYRANRNRVEYSEPTDTATVLDQALHSAV